MPVFFNSGGRGGVSIFAEVEINFGNLGRVEINFGFFCGLAEFHFSMTCHLFQNYKIRDTIEVL